MFDLGLWMLSLQKQAQLTPGYILSCIFGWNGDEWRSSQLSPPGNHMILTEMRQSSSCCIRCMNNTGCDMGFTFWINTVPDLFQNSSATIYNTSFNIEVCRYHHGHTQFGEFFEWGLLYKPEIQATISALHAPVIFHWYLYTEVHHLTCLQLPMFFMLTQWQGQSLWCLVGGLVHLAVELGLHHSPFMQGIFTKAECQPCICLWGIVMVHDWGISIFIPIVPKMDSCPMVQKILCSPNRL